MSELQIGPDGGLWFIAGDAVLRLGNGQTKSTAPTPDLATMNAPELVACLSNANSWHRDTALRALEWRKELRAARGLHPSTELHKIWEEKTNAPLTRLYALWGLHRVNLLNEGVLEDGTEDASPLLRAWSARLFGERKYPTGPALEKLGKMARDTNSTVRSAVAIAARQFVSGSFTRDTTPPSIPIREVFTGGILSSLWFSAEKGSTPEFNLLFWNALKPITAFDAAHALGFFQGDHEEGMVLAYWLIKRIIRQVAETDDPLRQEDAMLMLARIKPINYRLLTCALEGLKDGSPKRRATPTEKSRETLREFGKSQHQDLARLAREISTAWSKSASKD